MHLWKLLPFTAMVLSLVLFGCGASEESLEEGDETAWDTTPTVSPTAKLEYRIDSLVNENRRMKEQTEAVTAENRRLTARTAELETRVSESTAAGSAPVSAPSMASAPAAGSAGYDAALALYKQRKYADAIGQFEALLGANSPMADNCEYWIGESHYALRQYDQAIGRFEKVLGFASSNKKPYAQLMIGNAYAAKGDRASARQAYEKMVAEYPASALVEKAKQHLARMK
jgi:TolA-binding protein